MAKLNLSQAAKVTGKNRTTIWRHINSGRLSAERDRDGLPFVDTSELIRVYGELKRSATHDDDRKQHNVTHTYVELVEVIESLRREQAEMKEQLIHLTHRLENKAVEYVNKSTEPESDPSWPQEVKTMADVALRNEIKNRYSK